MTPAKAKALLPIITAFAEGKTVQVFCTDAWTDIADAGFHEKPERYRIKPEPTWRPWKADEIPVGAVVRDKFAHDTRSLLTGTWFNGAEYIPQGQGLSHPVTVFLDKCEWKWPHEPETAWRPCGVLQ